MTVKVLTEHHLDFLSLKGGCKGASESIHVKVPHCWKSHVTAHTYVSDEVEEECHVLHCSPGNCFGRICVLCILGYYVENFECHSCPDNCSKCSTSRRCEDCKPGTYGSTCQNNCPSGCKNNTCSAESGFCLEGCRDGHTMAGGQCVNCPITCVTCSTLDQCKDCKPGFWGSVCQYNCRECNGSGCEQNIACTKGCMDGYYVNTFQTNEYECIQCPEFCLECVHNSSCGTCHPGYWGNTCERRCDINCNNDVCRKDNGHCFEGCKNGYHGNKCEERCLTGCEKCHSKDDCETCAVGRYDEMCTNVCNEHCFRLICDRLNGSCTYGCSAGFTGDTCDTGQVKLCKTATLKKTKKIRPLIVKLPFIIKTFVLSIFE